MTPNEAVSFERYDHLVNRGRADLEVAPHVGFGGGAPGYVRVGVRDGEVVAMLLGEALGAGAAGRA